MRRSVLGVAATGLATAILIFASACADSRPKRSAASAMPVETATAPSEEASAAPSGSAETPDAAAIVDAGPPKPARPLVKVFDAPEETRSPLPKVAEWTDVPRRAVVTKPQYECTMQRVREWHRITCSCTNATVALAAGTRDGVSIWATATQAQLFFPVRRGDARAFEVLPHAHVVRIDNPGPYGPGAFEEEGGPPIVISETWLEGEDAPTLVVQ